MSYSIVDSTVDYVHDPQLVCTVIAIVMNSSERLDQHFQVALLLYQYLFLGTFHSSYHCVGYLLLQNSKLLSYAYHWHSH